MSDYIKREEAIQIAWCYVDDRDAIDELNGLPKADVVEVVRCKDCKYRKKNTFCLHNMRYEDDNGFCSYGERADT